MKRFVLLAITAAALGGCAENSGVMQMGPETSLVSRQAATGFTGAGTLKADALREAGQFCATKGKVIQVVSMTEAKPPYLLTNFPKAEVQFTCVSASTH